MKFWWFLYRVVDSSLVRLYLW